jgi:hypothetical protein
LHETPTTVRRIWTDVKTGGPVSIAVGRSILSPTDSCSQPLIPARYTLWMNHGPGDLSHVSAARRSARLVDPQAAMLPTERVGESGAPRAGALKGDSCTNEFGRPSSVRVGQEVAADPPKVIAPEGEFMLSPARTRSKRRLLRYFLEVARGAAVKEACSDYGLATILFGRRTERPPRSCFRRRPIGNGCIDGSGL